MIKIQELEKQYDNLTKKMNKAKTIEKILTLNEERNRININILREKKHLYLKRIRYDLRDINYNYQILK